MADLLAFTVLIAATSTIAYLVGRERGRREGRVDSWALELRHAAGWGVHPLGWNDTGEALDALGLDEIAKLPVADRVRAYSRGIQSSRFTVNAVRKAEGLSPLGWNDTGEALDYLERVEG